MSMKRFSRPTALKLAAILAGLNALSGFAMSIPLIPRGAAELDQTLDSPPYFVVVASLVICTISVIAAYGTWQQQRWGVILMLLINAIGALLAAPGIFGAPTTLLSIAATAGVLSSIVVIVLCLWRDPKPALKSSTRAPVSHRG